MQPNFPGARSGTAIVQAEATASNRSIAVSRATAKAAGLASRSAAAAFAGNAAFDFDAAGGDVLDDDDDDNVDLYISTSCHVGRNFQPSQNSLPAFTQRIDLPRRSTNDMRKRSDNEELRRARRDHFLSTVASENAREEPFFMGDAGDIETSPPEGAMTEPLKRRYWRLKSLPNDGDASQQQASNYRSRSVSRLHKQTNGSNRMLARSGSRYRSTDIDAALASSREHLMVMSFTDEDKKNASLFDLTARRECMSTAVNLVKSPSNPNHMQFLNGKSTNSLLETDIDTGEQSGQPIILETDVDTLDTYQVVPNRNKDKSYSLFNLTNLSASGYHRRSDINERSRKGAYGRAQSLQGIHNDDEVKTDSKSSSSKGLIARLKARATSTYELREVGS